jgi:hypothetical protein
MLVLTRLHVDSGYAELVLPAEILLGLGMGTAFVPAMSLATLNVEPRDTGVASAMVNAVQQMGGSIGTVLLNTIAASATTAYVGAHAALATTPGELSALKLTAMVHGFTSAIWWTVGILLLAAVITAVLVDMKAASAGGELVVPAEDVPTGDTPATSRQPA